jgi:hypothetical protein
MDHYHAINLHNTYSLLWASSSWQQRREEIASETTGLYNLYYWQRGSSRPCQTECLWWYSSPSDKSKYKKTIPDIPVARNTDLFKEYYLILGSVDKIDSQLWHRRTIIRYVVKKSSVGSYLWRSPDDNSHRSWCIQKGNHLPPAPVQGYVNLLGLW